MTTLLIAATLAPLGVPPLARHAVAARAVAGFTHGDLDPGSDDLADLPEEARGAAALITLCFIELARSAEGTTTQDIDRPMAFAAWTVRVALATAAAWSAPREQGKA